MKYNDKISVTGVYEGKLMLFVIELHHDDYICKKAVNLGKVDKLAIHSIKNIGNSVYMADSFNNKIYKYEYESNDITDVMVGRDPRHMCIDDNNNMYVANFESDNISVIDLSNFILIESVPAGIKPHDILYDNASNNIYICCYEENQIIEYSINKEIIRQITVDGKPMHMFIAKDSIIVMSYYVNGNVHTKVNFISLKTGKIEKVLTLDGLGSDFDIDYERGLLHLINIVDKNLYIIDTEKKETVKTVFLGGYPEGLTVGKNNVYITNSKKNQIISIDSNDLDISNIINLGFSPNCIKLISN